jgi:hypothetical protein
MSGYAYPVGAAGAEYPSKTVAAPIDAASTPVTIFTATKKTRVNSVLLANNDFGILPVKLYLNDIEINSVRVLKTKYAILPLTSTGGRNDDPTDPTLDRNKVNVEFILSVGDVLKASCPIADAVNVAVNLSEGVK